MIRYTLHFHLICHLFVSKHAEPLIGEKVQPANPEDFTFIASLGLKYQSFKLPRHHFCGGSLITKRHVLTAAHCLADYSFGEVDVIIGEVNLAIPSTPYNVDAWVTYNQWAMAQRKRIESLKNDIAIVVLKTVVDCPGVKPIVITDLNNEQLYGSSAVVAGWGITNTGRLSDVLLKARVRILSPRECFKKQKLVTNKNLSGHRRFLCSWAEPYALTNCGDSGGPVFAQNNFLLGVLTGSCPSEIHQWGNFSVEFLNQYKVNLHQSVDYYRDFIEGLTGLRTRR